MRIHGWKAALSLILILVYSAVSVASLPVRCAAVCASDSWEGNSGGGTTVIDPNQQSSGAQGATGSTADVSDLYQWKATVTTEVDQLTLTVGVITGTSLPALQEQAEQMGGKITNLETVQSAHGTSIEELQSQYQSLADSMSQTASEVTELGNSLADALDSIDSLGDSVGQLNSDVSGLSDNVTTLASGLAEANASISSLGGIAGGNNIKADKFFNGEPEATPEPTGAPGITDPSVL